MKKSTGKWMVLGAALILSSLFTVKAEGIAITKRLAGSNRYQTAVAVSKEGWQYSSYVVLVTGENYPDALSAAPLAAKYNCPILLSLQDNLDINTSVELKRLRATNVLIVGGTGVISKNVEDKITSMGMKVKRYAGSSRYETAMEVAKALGNQKQAVLVNGEGFADAVSVAPLAAAKGIPILLTPGDSLLPSTRAYLTNKGMEQVYAMGGTDQISDNAISGISNVRRILGSNVYERNTAAISAFSANIDFGTTFISTANDYPDALAGSVLAAKTKSALVLVDRDIPEDLKVFLNSKVIHQFTVLGGSAAVSYNMEKSIKSLPLEVSNTNSITETIQQNQSYAPPKTIIVTTSDNSKAEVPVKWNLSKIDTTKPGIFTFKGEVDGYDEDVTLTLYVKANVYKVDDVEAEAEFKDSYVVPDTVAAQMTDGTMSDVPVTWSYPSSTSSKPGVYVFTGKVDGYSKAVKLTLTIKEPDDQPWDPDNPDEEYIAEIGDEVIQDDKYTLEKEVNAEMNDGTKKKITVDWGNAKVNTNILGKAVIEGKVKGYSGKVKLNLTVKPKVYKVNDIDIKVTRNFQYNLPDSVRVEMTDHSKPKLSVKWNLNSVDTSNTGTRVIKGTIDTYGNAVTATITVTEDMPVTFADSDLEDVIREKVGKTDRSKKLYKSDVEGIKALDASHENITELTGIDNLVSLQDLDLSGNNIDDLVGLANLTGLQRLNLKGNNIAILTALSGLYNLTELNLKDNRIDKVRDLKNLNQLKKLYLDGNNIADYSPIIYFYKDLTDSDFSF